MAIYPLQTQIFTQITYIYNHVTILQYAYELLITMKHKYIFLEEEKIKIGEIIYNYIVFFIINIEGNS